MNVGLGNLTELKTQLLAKALRASADFDAVITGVGKGVAGRFQKFCNRQFERAVDTTFTCSADRDHVYLDRYPIEAISAVHLRTDAQTGWEEQTNFILNQDERLGKVFWGYQAAPHYGQLRFTFTGGYWFDTTEDATGVMPEGATPLPDELKLAWYLQCRAIWQALDKLGTKITEVGDTGTTTIVAETKLSPEVQAILMAHRRLQLT
jgi:hypothetical protein